MSAASIDDLVRAESGLNRAFVGYLTAILGSLAWSMYWPTLPEAQRLNVALVSIIFIVAAVVTPTSDVVTQAMMAAPMIVLYGFSIVIAWIFGRRKAPR